VDVGDGRTSFTFHAPAPPSATISRAPAPLPETTPPTAGAPAAQETVEFKPIPLGGGGGATIARAATTPGGGSDDGYEAFLDKLKRDLLRERELYGDLLGDLSW
jgi:hypothetical protein